ATVKMSPFLKLYVPRPLIASVDPVCPALETIGVAVVNVPVVCVGRSGSQNHSSTPSAAPANCPDRKYLLICACGLNCAKFAASNLLCDFGSRTAINSSGTPR